MDKYSSKPLPMAPSIPRRSSFCKALEKQSSEPGWPRRSSSLPRLPSTSEELETLPTATYVSPHAHHRRLSDDPESLRLVEQRSVHVDLPSSTYKGAVFRLPTPSPPASPPLRHKNGHSNLHSVAISGGSKKRECYILPRGQLEISFTPPSPVPSPRLPMKAPKPPRRTSRGNERRHKTLVVLEIIMEERRLPKMVKRAKRNSLALAYVRNISGQSRQSKRRSSALQPKTRCPQIVEDVEDAVKGDVVEDVDDNAVAAGTTAITEAEAPSSPELPFTVVYRQILKERWAKYRLLDASREAEEKRSVADFLAKTYPREPPPPRKQQLVVYPRCADWDKPHKQVPFPTFPDFGTLQERSIELRELAISAPKNGGAERRLTVSSPKLFSSRKEEEMTWATRQATKGVGKKHFWSRAATKPVMPMWRADYKRRD